MITPILEVLQRKEGLLVFGHRGYAAKAPENTLPSFQRCLDAGVPAVEFDVHLCGTGELVVIHDDNLSRTTGFQGKVKETPLKEIREQDAGSWYAPEFRGARVPLLEEVFELLGDSMYYDIEIKWKVSRLGGLEEKLIDLVRRFGYERNCIFTSFNPVSLKKTRSLAPDISTGLLFTDTSDELPKALRHGAGKYICRPKTLNPDKHMVTRTFMFLQHRIARYPVIPYTVNTPEEVTRLTDLGVSGIISDDPGMVLTVIADSCGKPRLKPDS
ncbi:MAG: glycerophosphodiester phosphodiesterase [Spirochaetales bacterium]|nr:glycerophosphodiester phosphodiesterase [Spirochaetales bacterium]